MWLLDPEGERRRERRLGAKDERRPAGNERLYCAACRRLITDKDDKIARRGSHAHTFSNPQGYTFRIGCFRAALGCAARGASTAEHTWFSGYHWQVAVCGRCGTQLGWLYRASTDTFYGLILDRLVTGGDH